MRVNVISVVPKQLKLTPVSEVVACFYFASSHFICNGLIFLEGKRNKDRIPSMESFSLQVGGGHFGWS